MVAQPRSLNNSAAQEVCELLCAGALFTYVSYSGTSCCEGPFLEQHWFVFGLSSFYVYWLPDRRRAYLSSDALGFCHSINIYLWLHHFYF